MPTPAEILLELSPLTAPATPAEHLLAIAELGTGTPGPPTVVVDIRVYEGIEGVLEVEEDVLATVVDEDVMAAVIADDEVFEAVLASEDDIAAVVADEDVLVGVVQDSEFCGDGPQYPDGSPILPLHSVYWGSSANANIATAAEVLALGETAQLGTPSLQVFVSPDLEYVYYAFPTSMTDPGVDGFEIGNFGPGDVVKLASNVDIGGVAYTLYRSVNLLQYTDLSFKVVV